MLTVVIEMKGGCLQQVLANEEDMQVIVIDHDEPQVAETGFFPVTPLSAEDEAMYIEVASKE